jgi:hypothetical protein
VLPRGKRYIDKDALLARRVPQVAIGKGKTRPWNTRLLIWTLDVLGQWWRAIAVGLVGAIILFMQWARSKEGCRVWDAFALRLPVIGELVRTVNVNVSAVRAHAWHDAPGGCANAARARDRQAARRQRADPGPHRWSRSARRPSSSSSARVNDKDSNDSWGKPRTMLCGTNLPAGVRGLAVTSTGEDGQEGTPDDLKSWE